MVGCLVGWFLDIIYYALAQKIQIPLELGAVWEFVFPKKCLGIVMHGLAQEQLTTFTPSSWHRALDWCAPQRIISS